MQVYIILSKKDGEFNTPTKIVGVYEKLEDAETEVLINIRKTHGMNFYTIIEKDILTDTLDNLDNPYRKSF